MGNMISYAIMKSVINDVKNGKYKRTKEKDRYISNYKPSLYEHLKPQRNGQCPCGSGKKYKNCCIDKREE